MIRIVYRSKYDMIRIVSYAFNSLRPHGSAMVVAWEVTPWLLPEQWARLQAWFPWHSWSYWSNSVHTKPTGLHTVRVTNGGLKQNFFFFFFEWIFKTVVVSVVEGVFLFIDYSVVFAGQLCIGDTIIDLEVFIEILQGPLLLTMFNLNPSMDKWLHPL